MPSRSSTRSQQTTMGKPSEGSRTERPRPGGPAQEAGRAAARPDEARSPKDKTHKSMGDIERSGRQSDQGGRPGSGKQRPSGRGR